MKEELSPTQSAARCVGVRRAAGGDNADTREPALWSGRPFLPPRSGFSGMVCKYAISVFVMLFIYNKLDIYP